MVAYLDDVGPMRFSSTVLRGFVQFRKLILTFDLQSFLLTVLFQCMHTGIEIYLAKIDFKMSWW